MPHHVSINPRTGNGMKMPWSTQQGFTLVELMIALAIGLLVMAAASLAFVSSSRTTRVSEADTTMNEEGLIALSILQQQLRQAGYFSPTRPTADPRNFAGASIRACDGGFKDAKVAFNDLDCEGGDGADAIAIRYEADASNAVQSDAKPTNCTGAAIDGGFGSNIAGGTNFTMADNRYFVDNNSLSCQGATGPAAYDASAQALMANVEDMQFQFGVTATSGYTDHQIINYLTATQINTKHKGAPAEDHWSRVASVRICVLLKTTHQVNKDMLDAAKDYRDCAGATKSSTDGIGRRSYITTVALRNRTAVPTRTE